MNRVCLWMAVGLLFGALFCVQGCAQRVRCGPNDCAKGEVCCNRGCGICTKPQDACIMPFCYWGRPMVINPENVPNAEVYDRVSTGISLGRQETDRAPIEPLTEDGMSAWAGWQHYIRRNTAVRLRASGTRRLGNVTSDNESLGGSLSAGGTYLFTHIRTRLRLAATLDAEVRDGRDFIGHLAPVTLGDGRSGSVAGALTFSEARSIFPVTAYARYIQTFTDIDNAPGGIIDIGVGAGDELNWLQWIGFVSLPIGVRANYRYMRSVTGGDFQAHELGGGLYFTPSPQTMRLGFDLTRTWNTFDNRPNINALQGMLRLDIYWDANY